MQWLALATILLCGAAHSFKILGLFPYPGKSHFLIFEPLMKALANQGHDVTVISHFPQEKSHPNYKDISLKGTQEDFVGAIGLNDVPNLRLKHYAIPMVLAYVGYNDCEKGLKSKLFADFLNEKHEFDVVIVESFDTDCFLSVVYKLGAPFILISSSPMMPWNYEHMGNPDHPAYIANHFMDYSDQLTFVERVENVVVNIYHQVLYGVAMNWISSKVTNEVFGDDVPRPSAIAKNASLLFVNTHFTISRPKPLVPGIIEISGLHIGKAKALPNVSKLSQFHQHYFPPYVL